MMRPTNGRQAFSSAARVSGGTGASESTRPLRSCVSVVIPKRSVATYSLSWSTRYGMSFVASPMRTGSTPVASGSSGPPWPARPPLGQAAGHRAPGGVGVTPATELGGDPLHVDVALGPHTDFHRTVAFTQEAGDADRGHGARVVDQVLGLDETLGQRPGRQREPREPPVLTRLHTSQGLAEPPEGVRGAALVQPLRHERRLR